MNLRQYQPSVVVQAGRIQSIDGSGLIRIFDNSGAILELATGEPMVQNFEPGSWLLVFPDGHIQVLPDDVFQRDWNPVSGAVLS